MIKLSVVIVTFNEEKNIKQCLESVKDIADEVIIVDAKSSDNTLEIVRKFKTSIYSVTNKPIFHLNKQLGLEKAKGMWILQLDADERVTDELRKEIRQVISQNSENNGYYLPRKNFFLGKFMKKGGLYPDYVIRLIRNGKAHFPCKNVHEQIEVTGKVSWLISPLLHYPYPIISTYLVKANRYTTLTSEELYRGKTKVNVINTLRYCLYIPLKTFINIYIRHQGFRDGLYGFIWAFLSATHYFFAYTKLLKKPL